VAVSDAADQIGIDPETVRVYVRDGCPHLRSGKKILLNVPEVLAWMKANGRTGKQGVSAADAELSDSPDLEAVRIRKETALAIKYEKQNEREAGVVIEVADVKRWIVDVFGTAKHKLIGMASAIAPRLEGLDGGERQVVIEKHVEQIIREIQDSCDSMA
jgi:glutaredoxin